MTAVAELEAFEGMLGTLPQQMVISEYFNYDRFGEVVVALPAPARSGRCAHRVVRARIARGGRQRSTSTPRSRITIDDGISSQNPDNVVHPITRDLFTLDNAFRGGDTVTGLTGPITYAFGLYRILPYGDGAGYAHVRQDGRPSGARAGRWQRSRGVDEHPQLLPDARLTLRSAGTGCVGRRQTMECRGADTADEFARQRVKLLNALEGLDADVIGLNELENTPGVEPLADIVPGSTSASAPAPTTYVDAGSTRLSAPTPSRSGSCIARLR